MPSDGHKYLLILLFLHSFPNQSTCAFSRTHFVLSFLFPLVLTELIRVTVKCVLQAAVHFFKLYLPGGLGCTLGNTLPNVFGLCCQRQMEVVENHLRVRGCMS